MREALYIFRKDVRHFRAQLAGFLSLMGLLAWAEVETPRDTAWATAGVICQWLLIPAAWYLVALAIHEQRLPGDRQYWLTRPYPRRSLLLAKALFVAAFLNAPLLALQIAALAANGLSPFAYWRALAARQFFFTALMVLPAAALAAVTVSLAQFAIGVFAAFGVVLAIELGGGNPPSQWRGLAWIESSATGGLALAIFGAVVLFQYSQRKTLRAAAGVACGVLVCASLPVLDLWSAAFAVQKQLGEASAVRWQFDAARDPAGGRPLPVDPELVRLGIPVQWTGIPAGMAVLGDRDAADIEAPGGVRWHSGWQPPFADDRTLRTEGPAWQLVTVDRRVFENVRNQPVHLRVRAAFTLLSAPSESRLPVPVDDRWVPDVGFCLTSPARVTCFSPFSHAAWVEAEARPAPPSSPEPVPLRAEISYAPYPTTAGFGLWTTDLDAMWMRPMPWKEIAIQTRRAVAHFELDLDIQDIRLAQYASAIGANP